MSAGSVEPLKRLHEKWGGEVQFLEVLIRQAHPGPGVEAYDSLERKMEDASRYVREEVIPWMVAVDDVPGKTHQVYGGVADPAYLIDSAGRVAFYSVWTNVPVLNRAIEQLLAQGGIGVVDEGIARRPRLSPVFANGWPAIRRGLPQSYIDLETAMPGAGTALWAGWMARPLLEERANRIEEPPPRPARERAAEALPAASVVAGAVAGAALAMILYQRFRA